MSDYKDPITADEWQVAVDAAQFYLLIDAAVQYGLITIESADPDFAIDSDRCQAILQRGAARGIYPRKKAA